MSSDNTDLTIRQSAELQATKDAVREAQEVRAAIQLAREFPRNEEAAYQGLMRSCKRGSFAFSAVYRFKRGKKKNDNGDWVDNYVEGPSVALQREFARLWGNIQYGAVVVREDDDQRTIRGFAWDVETNTRIVQEAVFKKLIQRKNKSTGETEWVEPDERDLRELANKHGSIATRNCVLQVLPKDYVDDAVAECKRTQADEVRRDPDAAKKSIIKAFGELNIPISQVEELVGHGLDTCSPAEIVELRQIWKSVADGAATWASFFSDEEQPMASGAGDVKLAAKTDSRLNAAINRARGTVAAPVAEPVAAAPVKTQAELEAEVASAQERLQAARKAAGILAGVAMTPISEALPKSQPPMVVAPETATDNEPQLPQAELLPPIGKGKGDKPKGVPLSFK